MPDDASDPIADLLDEELGALSALGHELGDADWDVPTALPGWTVKDCFSHVVETERRFYLANSVDVKVRSDGGEVYFDVTMADAWVWDVYRPARFVKNVRVVTFKDVNIEELAKSDLELPDDGKFKG